MCGEIPQKIDVGVDLLGQTVARATLLGRANTLLAVNEVSQLHTFLATLEFAGLLKFFSFGGVELGSHCG